MGTKMANQSDYSLTDSEEEWKADLDRRQRESFNQSDNYDTFDDDDVLQGITDED